MGLLNKPLVSCLIVSHNKGRWVESCIRSLLDQAYRPIEVIVCDNGSTDNSPALIRMFGNIPNLKCIFHPEALGVSRAFNLALSNAKGDYIATLGADDVARSNHLDLLMDIALTNPDIDMIFGDLEEIDASGKVVRYVSAANGLASIFNRCSVGHATGVTKKSVYDELGGYDESLTMSVDWEFVIRILKAGKKVLYAGETGYQWRRIKDGKQLTMKYGIKSEERIKSHSYIFKKHGLSGPCGCGCGAKP